MKKHLSLVCFLLLGGTGLQGAGIEVVATTGMVADLVRRTGGDRVEVRQLMGPGVDPHLYKATAADAANLAKADAIFYNGLNLEGRMADLFTRLGRQGVKVYAVSESVSEDRLLTPEESEGYFDPHIWLDPALWAEAVPTVVAGLSAADPEGGETYRANGDKLAAELRQLDEWCRAQTAKLPDKNRILVTSHDAFNYFGRAYGFRVVALQGISTVSETSLADMTGMVDFLREQKVAAIFVETSVNPAALQRVSRDAGVRIGGELYSDALGERGQLEGGYDVGTYDGMMRYNLSTIVKGLGEPHE